MRAGDGMLACGVMAESGHNFRGGLLDCSGFVHRQENGARLATDRSRNNNPRSRLMNSLAALTPLALVVLVSGALIGCVGIGGVLLVPALAYIGGVDVHLAIASVMLSYFFAGALGTFLYAREGSITWTMSTVLCAGAMPGAFAGSVVVHSVPASALELLIGVLVILSGLHALRTPGESHFGRVLGPGALVVIGAVTGFGSALTGTGGPLLLVPLLVWLGQSVLVSIGLAQVIQVPIAVLATVGNLTYGEVDLTIALLVAALLMIGVTGGARLAHTISVEALKRVVAWVMVGVGVLIVLRILSKWLAT